MNNGIKPTRLWRLTGMKHCARWLREKREACPPFEQRDKYEALKFMGLLSTSLLGLAFSYGMLCPPPEESIIITSPECTQKKTVIRQDRNNPCPDEVPCKVPKCRKQAVADKDDRPVCKYD